MKTIEEKLQWYLDLPIDKEHQQGFSLGFRKCAEFMQRWIPICEGMPEKYLDIKSSMDTTVCSTDQVLVRTVDDGLKLTHRVKYNGLWIWAGLENVVEWRPIYLY